MPQYKKNVYVLSSIYEGSIDGIRNAVGNYWTGATFFPDYGDLVKNNVSPQLKKKVKKVNSIKIIPRKTKTKNLKKFPFLETKHDFEIYADKSLYGDDTAWIRYVQNIYNPAVVYMDFCFDVENPIASGEFEVQNFSPSMVYEKADFKYNYYSRLYELTTGNSRTKETILPNLYMFLLSREDETNDKFFQALTAGGELEKSAIKSVRVGKEEEFPEYFEVFGKAQRSLSIDKIENIASKSKNIIFDTKSEEIFKQAEDLATSFPMQVALEFAADAATEFTEVLSDSDLETSLISYLSLLPRNPTLEEQEKFFIKEEPMERFFEEITPSADDDPSQTTVNSSSPTVKIIDIEKWMKKISKNKKIVRSKDTSIIGQKSKADMASAFEKMMYMIIFSGKLKGMIDKYHRSYTDISDGTKSYSETFCYKIEKFSETTGSEPIQTIWLPNSNKLDVIKYIDTQVKYGKKYTYRASAYQFVIGSEYRYCDLNFPDTYDAPSNISDTLVQNGQAPGLADFSNTTARSSAIEEPMPILNLEKDYSRYFTNSEIFAEHADDLSDRPVFYYSSSVEEIRKYIKAFQDYNIPVGHLRGVQVIRSDLPPLPAYYDNTKTIFNIFRNQLSSMKGKINGFLERFNDSYIPSLESQEKKDSLKIIGDDLRKATGWIALMDTFYLTYEQKMREFSEKLEALNTSRDADTRLAYDRMNEIVEETKNLSIQFSKYYDDLYNILYKYRVINESKPEEMRPALQAMIRNANAGTSTVATTNFGAMQSLEPGQSGMFATVPADAMDKRDYGEIEEEEADMVVEGLGQEIKSPKYFISTDKRIFKTKYANRLYVVAKKRESVNDDKYFKASLSVKVQPSIKIAEVPFFETTGVISDNPPVPPEVTMIPYKGVKDKVLINLNTAVGKYEMMPVTFNRLEELKVEEIRESKRLPPNSKITYSTDDRVEAFEIYRLDRPPEKIEDFADNLRKYLETDVSSLTLQKASSASFIDNLNSNTDYYYIFRAVDVHGNVSNPTEVRKIRIVENDGVVYPLMEIYQMKKIMPQTTSKKCKKLLNIVPRSTQTLIDMSKSDIGDGLSAKNVKRVSLGQEDVGLFGKKFKIRLTSQKTGKQIDLNINFKVDYKQI